MDQSDRNLRRLRLRRDSDHAPHDLQALFGLLVSTANLDTMLVVLAFRIRAGRLQRQCRHLNVTCRHPDDCESPPTMATKSAATCSLRIGHPGDRCSSADQGLLLGAGIAQLQVCSLVLSRGHPEYHSRSATLVFVTRA